MATDGPRDQTVQLGDLKLHYVEWGDAASPPMVLLHGFMAHARTWDLFARDLQVQERLTQQTADWLQTNLAPKGVGVVIEAEHLCMSLRGVRAAGTRTVTSALHGALREDDRSRQEFALAVGTR